MNEQTYTARAMEADFCQLPNLSHRQPLVHIAMGNARGFLCPETNFLARNGEDRLRGNPGEENPSPREFLMWIPLLTSFLQDVRVDFNLHSFASDTRRPQKFPTDEPTHWTADGTAFCGLSLSSNVSVGLFLRDHAGFNLPLDVSPA